MAVIRLANASLDTTVKIKLDGVLEDFIVKQVGIPSTAPEGMYDVSCDGVWVVSKWLLPTAMQYATSEGQNYASSTINEYLNRTEDGFLSKLDPGFLENLPPVKIPYNTDGSYTGGDARTKTGADGLEVRAFILSLREIRGSGYWVCPTVGAQLDGFTSQYYDCYTKDAPDKQKQYWGREQAYNPSVSSTRYYVGVMYPYKVNDNFTQTGASFSGKLNTDCYVLPVMILPKTWHYDTETGEVFYSSPTAPGSIDVSNVVSGETATITLTAATDEDGTIASYVYERQVDGGIDWQQIANVNSLTCQDTISADWATVAYRACAVDDKGVPGEYVTSETFDVNAGWVVISGPAEALGDRPAPFDLVFSLSVTGEYGTQGMEYAVALDGESFKTGSESVGEQITVPIDTRKLGAGEHTIEVTASKDLFVPAAKRYTFTVPAAVLPDGGKAGVFRGPDGKPIFPLTLAQQVIGKGGVDLGTLIRYLAVGAAQMEYGTYVGTGTWGKDNPNKIKFSFAPVLIIVGSSQSLYNNIGITSIMLWMNGTTPWNTTANNATLSEDNEFSWYYSTAGSTADADNQQYNIEGRTYGYIALGLKEGIA